MKKTEALELISKITERVNKVGEDAFLKGVFADVTLVNDIFKTYKQIMNKVWNVTCKSCYFDCYAALYGLTRINNKTLEEMENKIYELKPGVLLEGWRYGDNSKMCTNKNLTNELAEWFLSKCPPTIKLFSVYPADWEQRCVAFVENIPFIPETPEPKKTTIEVTDITIKEMLAELDALGLTDKNTFKLKKADLYEFWLKNKK